MTDSGLQQRLAAILADNAAGYSRLMSIDDKATMAAVRQSARGPSLTRAGGYSGAIAKRPSFRRCDTASQVHRFTCYAEITVLQATSAMSNLTVSVDEQLIKRARLRGIEQSTSLSAKVREFLLGYVNGSPDALAQQRAESTARLLAAIDAAAALIKPAAPAALAARGQRRSLRGEIYEGDYRVRSRVDAVATADATAKTGKGCHDARPAGHRHHAARRAAHRRGRDAG